MNTTQAIILYTSQNSFRKKPKTILPLPTGRQASKVLGVSQSGDNCNQDLVFEKTKNQTGFSIHTNFKQKRGKK